MDPRAYWLGSPSLTKRARFQARQQNVPLEGQPRRFGCLWSDSSARTCCPKELNQEAYTDNVRMRGGLRPRRRNTALLHCLSKQDDVGCPGDVALRGASTPLFVALLDSSVSPILLAVSPSQLPTCPRRYAAHVGPLVWLPFTWWHLCYLVRSLYTTPTSRIQNLRAVTPSREGGGHLKNLMEVQKGSGGKLQDVYKCEGCPSKPKEFATGKELR